MTTHDAGEARAAVAPVAEHQRLGYQPALDGLRAVAVGLVVLSHLESPERSAWFVRGDANIGVDIFFVISGFLITRLMLDERETTGRISLIDFWKRRAYRLLPLAVAVIGVVWLIDLVWSGAFFRSGADVSSTRSAFAALTYHTNFLMLSESTRHVWALTHTWSLSIEEQFYLIWPLLVIAFIRCSRRSPAIGVLIGSMCIVVASSIVRFITADDLDRLYNGLDARAGQLCLGCALGAASICAPRFVSRIGRFGPLSIAVLVLIGFTFRITFKWSGFGLDVVAILAAVAVAGALHRAPDFFNDIATSPLALAVGVRSYAIYLVHYPVFLMLTPTRLDFLPTPLMWLVRLAVAAVVTEFFHRAVERRVADWRKQRLAR